MTDKERAEATYGKLHGQMVTRILAETDVSFIAQAITAARAEEREACAKLAESMSYDPANDRHQFDSDPAEIAAAIRERK
jgi:hypothetical protein